MLVTDIKRIIHKGTKKERELTGFYMDRWLKENIDPIPKFLSKAWDCVGIVSGHGKVRIGKSTLAAQVSFYLAWRLAGGEMAVDDKGNAYVAKHPAREVRFTLKENVVFSAEDLQDAATKLYEKYGKNQVLLYDEGRQGLDSARSMESINKGMEDFFQECGFMGHVIIIVLPSFFKLKEDYAVSRSLFLIDVFADKKFTRGYFNFYNEHQKEYLYYFGKKRIGTTAKYNATSESFWGRFTSWLPFDKDEYEELKKQGIEKKRRNKVQERSLLQRDFFIWLVKRETKLTAKQIHEKFKEMLGADLSTETINNSVEKISNICAARLRKMGTTSKKIIPEA